MDTRSRDSTGRSFSTIVPFNHISRGGVYSGRHSSSSSPVSRHGSSGTLLPSSPSVSLPSLCSTQPFRESSSHLPSDINIPIFLISYFGYKIIKKTKIRRWDEMDFVTGIPPPEDTEIPEVPPKNIWERIASFVF